MVNLLSTWFAELRGGRDAYRERCAEVVASKRCPVPVFTMFRQAVGRFNMQVDDLVNVT